MILKAVAPQSIYSRTRILPFRRAIPDWTDSRLAWATKSKATSTSDDAAKYRQHSAKVTNSRQAITRAAQGVTIPEVANRERREACIVDFRLFCETYGWIEFNLPWADFHLAAMERITAAVCEDHWYAFAMPRGSGKTSLAEYAVLWAALSGRREFSLFIAANQILADQQLQTIKTTLATNDLLCEDFPHAVYPIVALENETRRCRGQRNSADGLNTYIEWGQSRIVLPQVHHADSLSSGFVIQAFGLETAKRGIKFKRGDGTTIRPSFVVADDPQTRESSASPSQTRRRIETLVGDVAYLAGPAKPLSIILPTTVIYREDLADQILNRDNHPEWHGQRWKMVEQFPTDMSRWDEYGDILRASLREDGGTSAATEFYEQHREEMDAGFVVSWPDRFRPGELSAIQHAMNLRIRDFAAFYAEMQNEPVMEQADELGMRPVDSICTHVTNYGRWQIPAECQTLTAFTDVQGEHLFWMVCGWTPGFTGHVIAYGAWPDQQRSYFTRQDVRQQLSHVYEGDESAMMFRAFTDLEEMLFQERVNVDGKLASIDRWCIDGGWERRKPALKSFVSQSIRRNQIAITHGFGVRAKERPFSASPRLVEQRTGPAWYWTDGKKPGGDVTFDTNFWKTRCHEALALPLLSRGSLQLHKATPYQHRMLAEHLHAEAPVRVDAKGRTVYEWEPKPNRDNEGLDCLVGCMVAASMAGVRPDEEMIQRKTRRLSLSQYAERARKRA